MKILQWPRKSQQLRSVIDLAKINLRDQKGHGVHEISIIVSARGSEAWTFCIQSCFSDVSLLLNRFNAKLFPFLCFFTVCFFMVFYTPWFIFTVWNCAYQWFTEQSSLPIIQSYESKSSNTHRWNNHHKSHKKECTCFCVKSFLAKKFNRAFF